MYCPFPGHWRSIIQENMMRCLNSLNDQEFIDVMQECARNGYLSALELAYNSDRGNVLSVPQQHYSGGLCTIENEAMGHAAWRGDTATIKYLTLTRKISTETLGPGPEWSSEDDGYTYSVWRTSVVFDEETTLGLNDWQWRFTPLCLAAWGGHVETTQFLLGLGANIDSQASSGFETALHSVCRTSMDSTSIAEILIQNMANINLTDTDGLTPLHRAVFESNLLGLDILLENGADIEQKTLRGVFDDESPLTLARFRSHDLVQHLVSKGADVNATIAGASILETIALRDSGPEDVRAQRVELFLKCGTDPTRPSHFMRDKFGGSTALSTWLNAFFKRPWDEGAIERIIINLLGRADERDLCRTLTVLCLRGDPISGADIIRQCIIAGAPTFKLAFALCQGPSDVAAKKFVLSGVLSDLGYDLGHESLYDLIRLLLPSPEERKAVLACLVSK